MKKVLQSSKYYLILCLLFLFTNASLGYVLIRQSVGALRSMIESRMQDVANTAAAMLDGDVLETLDADSRGTPEYQAALHTLDSFLENIELEYIYCIRDLGGGNFVFMIDPDHEDPGKFGDPIGYTDALYRASLGTPAVDDVPYEDKWGKFYSAYSPVFNSEGKVSGIVSVDFNAKWYEKQIYSLVESTVFVIGTSILIAALVIVLITARHRKRYLLLLKEINDVSDDIETLVREVSPGTGTIPHEEEGAAGGGYEITEIDKRLTFLRKLLEKRILFVRSQAYVDGLTGLGNRTAYEDHVKRLDDEAREGRADFSIALFDINGLKEINDRLGHEKGDEAIREAASVLKQVFEGAELYRIGGDEFIVICEGKGSFLHERFERLREKTDCVSMSMGFAEYIPEKDSGYHRVFNRADNAMYEDKIVYYLTHERRRASISL